MLIRYRSINEYKMQIELQKNLNGKTNAVYDEKGEKKRIVINSYLDLTNEMFLLLSFNTI